VGRTVTITAPTAPPLTTLGSRVLRADSA
jgi:hypothetical protein